VRPAKKGVGEKHVPVSIAGTMVYDGDWLYADSDGILVASSEMAA
jgi:regulator of RNase E activity RraA